MPATVIDNETADALKLQMLRPACGVYENVPDDLYHAWNLCSNSRLTTIRSKSEAHMRYDADNPKNPTPALVLGSAVHMRTLQPHLFDERYVIAKRCSATLTKGGACKNDGKFIVGGDWLCGVHAKADRHSHVFSFISGDLEAQGYLLREVSEHGSKYYDHPDGRKARVSDHPSSAHGKLLMLRDGRQDIRVDLPPHGSDDGRTVLSPDQWDALRGIEDSLGKHPEASALLADGGQRELSIVFEAPMWGLRCKLRTDIVAQSLDLIADLKTTESAHPDDFERSIFDYGYHRQAAFYQVGLSRHDIKLKNFGIVAIEKVPPYAVAVYQLKEDAIARGWEEIEPLLDRYARAEKSDKWPAYTGVKFIGIPAWAMRKAL